MGIISVLSYYMYSGVLINLSGELNNLCALYAYIYAAH